MLIQQFINQLFILKIKKLTTDSQREMGVLK